MKKLMFRGPWVSQTLIQLNPCHRQTQTLIMTLLKVLILRHWNCTEVWSYVIPGKLKPYDTYDKGPLSTTETYIMHLRSLVVTVRWHLMIPLGHSHIRSIQRWRCRGSVGQGVISKIKDLGFSLTQGHFPIFLFTTLISCPSTVSAQ